MLRAVWLTIGKEFLLIRRDRVGLFMLLVAPIAVIGRRRVLAGENLWRSHRSARRVFGGRA